MPRKPTGRPRGRQPGSGELGLGTQDDHMRLTLRMPHDLYARLEAFAAGRHFHRGSVHLAACVRDAIDHYLRCPTKRQTSNIPRNEEYHARQTSNGTQEAEDNNRQTANGAEDLDDDIGQTINVPSEALEAPEHYTRQTSNSTLPVPLDAEDIDARPREPVASARQPVAPAPPVMPVSPLSDKAAVLAQLDAWKAAGLSLQAMADRLDAAHVPTFRGKLGWSKGTIGNLLAKRQAQPA